MKILFDNQIFKMQKYGGVSRYFAELLNGLNSSSEFETIPRTFFSTNRHLRLKGLTYLDKITDDYHFRGKGRIESFIIKREEKRSLQFLKDGNFDVFHPTYYDPYFLEHLSPQTPFVLTVHDMIHEIYYDHNLEYLSDETRNKRLLIPKASHIVAVSQNTKNDILTFFPEVHESKISVIHLGSSLTRTPGKSNIKLPARYLLYIGVRARYKNFIWFLKTISDFLKEHKLTLVCAGGGNFTSYEVDRIRDYNLTENVIYVDSADDDELKVIYNKAIAMIFPSLHEGFGIPVLEAFTCECPAILNDNPCFREIAGNAALYFSVDKAEGLMDHLEALLKDKSVSASLKKEGLKRLELFSWEKTVKQHQEVYKLFESLPVNQS